MARKSNKTSHVLNLLTDSKSAETFTEYPNEISAPAEPAPVEDTASSEVIEPSNPTQETALDTAPESASINPQNRSSRKPAIPSDSTPTQASVDISQALEERISQQIHDSLSAQLAEDEQKEAERAEQDRKIAERIAAEMGAAMDTEQSTPPIEAEAAVPVEAHSPVQTADCQKEPQPEYDFELVNVMEAILDQFQTEFMQSFGMCTCHRCWLDTRALTLSSLNGKYVVLERDSIGPMLNFYDHRYRGMIMAQLTQACMAVMDNPHH